MENIDSEWEELMGADIRVKFAIKNTDQAIAAYGTTVTCNLKCYLTGTMELIEDLSDQRFKIGEGDAVPGLELPLRHSRIGDQFVVQCSSKFAYGPSGRPAISNAKSVPVRAIPPDSDLTFRVEVLKHENDDDLHAGSREHALFVLSVRKECGNRWFSYGDYSRAARAYSKGAEAADGYLKSIVEGTEDASLALLDESIIVDLYLACLNNLAACYLSKNENLKAKEVCIRVLELDPRNIKGLLRAARAALALFEFEETEACLKRVLDLEPENSLAASEMVKLRNAKRKYTESSKEMAKKMTKRLFTNEASPKPAASTIDPSPDAPKIAVDSQDAKVSGNSDGDELVKTSAEVKPPVPHEPARTYSVFMLLFSSVAIVIVSIVIALFARNTTS